MRIERLGHIFCADGERPWMHSHAANPVAVPLSPHRLRIYFSTRDKQQRSSIGYLEIDPRRPQDILRLSTRPVLTFGERGLFDDSGISLGGLVATPQQYFLYYLGWNLGVTVPWHNAIGLATSSDGLRFVKQGPGPLLDRDHHNPYSLSYPFVLKRGGRWLMWYGSNTKWGKGPRDFRFVLKQAISGDGKKWKTSPQAALALRRGESGLARPCVLPHRDGFRMWYSILRRGKYRLGYAESANGQMWKRRDADLRWTSSGKGWDSREQCYPFVFDHGSERLLLYCGNGYGKTGFGLARIEER